MGLFACYGFQRLTPPVEVHGVTLTSCGLQLLVFLFPPLPGLEDASQTGQLAVAANGRRTDP